MKLQKPNNESSWTPVPAGTHVARLYQIIDIGTQTRHYGNDEEIKRKLLFMWEVCEEKTEDGRPLSIKKEYNSSFHEKSSIAQHVKNWTGEIVNKDFDISTLLGKPCMLVVCHKNYSDQNGVEKLSVKVDGVSSLVKGMTAPELTNPTVLFDLDSFDHDVFMSLPQWMQDSIKLSPEYNNIIDAGTKGTDKPDIVDDEIPF